MKIIIIIGQSASGKTTFVKDKFLIGKITLQEDLGVKYTVTENNVCLLGDYTNMERRCIGTDMLSFTIMPKVVEFIKKHYIEFDTIVAEGDRINNKKLFDCVKSLNVSVDLYIFNCTLEESMKRRKDTGSDSSETFVKSTITKSINMKNYGRILGFNIIEINTSKRGLNYVFG